VLTLQEQQQAELVELELEQAELVEMRQGLRMATTELETMLIQRASLGKNEALQESSGGNNVICNSDYDEGMLPGGMLPGGMLPGYDEGMLPGCAVPTLDIVPDGEVFSGGHLGEYRQNGGSKAEFEVSGTSSFV